MKPATVHSRDPALAAGGDAAEHVRLPREVD
jgi:hypothetical protein